MKQIFRDCRDAPFSFVRVDESVYNDRVFFNQSFDFKVCQLEYDLRIGFSDDFQFAAGVARIGAKRLASRKKSNSLLAAAFTVRKSHAVRFGARFFCHRWKAEC